MGLLHEDFFLEADILSNRPAAGDVPVGAIFPASDEGYKQYRNNGSSWDQWGPDATPPGGGFVIPGLNQYRLSLVSGDPRPTAETTTASTLYWTPDQGEHCSLFDGADWQDYSGGELSLALSALTSGKNYDVFIDYNGGSPQIVLVAWTDDTTRATALTKQDGVYVKTGDTDHLYVGTIRTISTTATCDFGGGSSSQTGGKRFVWNYYNRIPRFLAVFDSTDTWNYSTNTWRQANAPAANQVEFVAGLVEDACHATVSVNGNPGGASVGGAISVGVNSTTAPSRLKAFAGVGSSQHNLTATFRGLPRLGYNFLAWLEIGNGTATMTWYGDAGTTYVQSGMDALIMA